MHHEVINVQSARKHHLYRMWSRIGMPGVSMTKDSVGLHVSDQMPLNADLGITSLEC